MLDNPKNPYSIALKNAVLPPNPKAAAAAIRDRRAFEGGRQRAV
ncbi:MAG: hypothetical protein MO852_13960 [Candidatus Devosia euplotis]|nr:hypothetical protein [Candidatus Devosia euplotis]